MAIDDVVESQPSWFPLGLFTVGLSVVVLLLAAFLFVMSSRESKLEKQVSEANTITTRLQADNRSLTAANSDLAKQLEAAKAKIKPAKKAEKKAAVTRKARHSKG